MATTLNKFDVRVLPKTTVLGEPAIEVQIDGIRLLDEVVRTEFAWVARGGQRRSTNAYGPLPFLDHRALMSAGETYLLGCAVCGEARCWPLTVTVTIANELVTWSGFQNRYVTFRGWDYRDLGPFRFDETEYMAMWSGALDLNDCWPF